MAFKLYKASGSRVPDLVSHLGAGATLGAAPAGVVNGVVLFIDTDGLEIAVTTNKVAGICAVEYKGANGALYAAASGAATATFPHGLVAGTKIPFLPVTGTVPIIADIEGTVALGAILPGEDLDIAAGGLTIADTTTNDDFHVVKVIDDGSNITHVVGFFINPGYFTA